MKDQRSQADPAILAQAAAWIAILHGPNRTAATEKGFARWLKTSPLHAAAFEEATQIWEDSRNLPRRNRVAMPRRGLQLLRPVSALVSGVALAGVALLLYVHFAGVTTRVGEQRVVTLEDGSRMILNTATRAIVSYDERHRKVELKDGEALFEVAKRPDWPFVVAAGDRRIEALGTTFGVRKDSRRLAVTLVEGKVQVTSVSQHEAGAQSKRSPAAEAVTLLPGQRVTFDVRQPAIIDQPPLQRVLAWQRREVSLDDTPLAEAVAEMNRYSIVPLVIEEPQAGQLRVTGLFRAGDSLSFGKAIAAAYDLEAIEERDRIVLRRAAH